MLSFFDNIEPTGGTEMTDLTIKQLFDGPSPRASRVARWDRRLWKIAMDVALFIALVATVLRFVNFSYNIDWRYSKDGWRLEQYSVDFGMPAQIEVHFNPETLESNVGEKLPKGVTVNTITAYAPLVSPGWKDAILLRVGIVPTTLLTLFIVWMLRKIVLTTVGSDTSEGNPFIRPNVRRLRWIALAIVLIPFVRHVSETALYHWSGFAMKGFEYMGAYYPPIFHPMPIGVGLLIFAMAEVFSTGIRLREDVEGLV
jgi:hypothetical protein